MSWQEREKFLLTTGKIDEAKKSNQLTTSPKFLHSKELKSSREKTFEHIRMESFENQFEGDCM